MMQSIATFPPGGEMGLTRYTRTPSDGTPGMGMEIEAKMKLEDRATVVARLVDLAAVCMGRFFERNTFFDTPERLLLARDEGLRLRECQDRAGLSECWLTHKGPNQPGRLKVRRETQVKVNNATSAERLLCALGFAACLSFEKRRESWRLRDCLVELDEVPRLGHFIEIEGPDEAAIMALRQELGLLDAPLIRDTYPKLLAQHARERGVLILDFTFSPEDRQTDNAATP